MATLCAFSGRVRLSLSMCCVLFLLSPPAVKDLHASFQDERASVAPLEYSSRIAEFTNSRIFARNAEALNRTVTLNFKDATRLQVLEFIAFHAGLRLAHAEDLVELNEAISIAGEELTVFEALQEATRDSRLLISLSYEGLLSVRKSAMHVPAVLPPAARRSILSRRLAGAITGTVRDADAGTVLPGATVRIEGTAIGAATDLNGRFRIASVPPGSQTLVVSYIGYRSNRMPVDVRDGATVDVDIELAFDTAEFGEVVVTAQASGQAAAINQQLTSNTIINVVSAERIQELPDANAAESIGRLPGISVQRSGGEGQKIVVRGLAPEFNQVTINGVAVPATDSEDRSVDLTMISPEMLSAIQVVKALTPDRDADALGGSVNLSIGEAPAGLRSNVSVQSGYGSLNNALGIYKGSGMVSNRLLNDRLGIMLTGSVERADRGSDVLGVSYSVQGNPAPGQDFVTPLISDQRHEDREEDRRRYGGSAILDFRLGDGYIRATNFASRLDRDRLRRLSAYSMSSNWATYELRESLDHTDMLSNTLQGEHHLFGTKVDWGVARQRSLTRTPYSHRIRFRELGAFHTGIDAEGPDQFPLGLNNNLDAAYLYAGQTERTRVRELELSAFANLQIPYRIGSQVSGYFQFGGKYREKDRTRKADGLAHRLDNSSWVREMSERYPDLTVLDNGYLSMSNWVNRNYDPRAFLNGRFQNVTMTGVIDRDLMNAFYPELDERYIFTWSPVMRDYHAFEGVTAGYAMTEFHLGRYLMFLPGFRYEQSRVSYLGYNGLEPRDGEEDDFVWENVRDTTATHASGSFLPMFHLRIQPTDWVNLRLAYTNSLSRPNYDMLSPRRIISHNSGTVRFGNTEIDPAQSRNYDAILSFFGNNLGLLTLGAFYKEIRDFSFTRQVTMVAGTEVDPAVLGLPNSTRGYLLSMPINNPWEANIRGLELDWQTHLHYLPNPLNGIVLNLNYTRMNSETHYPRTEVERNADPTGPRFIIRDTSFVAPLIRQPKHIANASFGYDRRGFSGRLSFNYQGDVLTQPGRRLEQVAHEKAFYRWDLMIRQRVTSGVSVFFNANNMSNHPDESINAVSGHPTSLEYYGFTMNVGLRYRPF